MTWLPVNIALGLQYHPATICVCHCWFLFKF